MGKRTLWWQKVKGPVLLVAVDLGKRTHTGYWRIPGQAESAVFSFGNTHAGLQAFWAQIRAVRAQSGVRHIQVGMEPTGPYGQPLLHFLQAYPVELVLVNPAHTKKYKEVVDNSPLKSDQKDPRILADLMELGRTLTVVLPTGPVATLRAVVQARATAVALRVAEESRLQDLLSVVFPEFLTVIRGVRSASAQAVLRRYPTPAAVVAAGPRRVTAVLHQASRGRLGAKRAAALGAAAQTSIGVAAGQAGLAAAVHWSLDRLQQAAAQEAAQEAAIDRLLAEIPASRALLSVPRIGRIIAATVLAELGDGAAFASQRAVLKWAGLNLYEVSSGRHRGRRRLSKRGRARLRQVLFCAALNAVRADGILHGYYHQLLDRGMPRPKAMTAVMRKLCHLLFALLRDNTVYQAPGAMRRAA